jgi:hypothetical protein
MVVPLDRLVSRKSPAVMFWAFYACSAGLLLLAHALLLTRHLCL